MRSQFTFYKSFDDVLEDLNDKQISEYIKKMLDVQFLRIKIDDVCFEDKLLSVIWKSQKHSIKSSINGYLDSQKRSGCKEPYLGCYDDDFIPYEGGYKAPYEGGHQQEQVKGKGKVKEQGSRIDKLSIKDMEDLNSFMIEHCKEENISTIEIDKFIDYWKSTTKNALKLDWKATFRNHCRQDWVKKANAYEVTGYE